MIPFVFFSAAVIPFVFFSAALISLRRRLPVVSFSFFSVVTSVDVRVLLFHRRADYRPRTRLLVSVSVANPLITDFGFVLLYILT
jgi:hypothetical protein